MPNAIPLQTIKDQLPSFVTIYDDTYKGVRYKARFHDLEYKEDFETTVREVIRLQHGCPSRANAKRRSTQKGMVKGRIPIDTVISQLPAYLEMDQSSYKGVRWPARFYDKEYKVWFEMMPANVIREGRGYCPERQRDEFKRQISVSRETIQKRLNALYQGRVLLGDDYVDTQTVCTWVVDGTKVRLLPSYVFNGKSFVRMALERWAHAVKARDAWTCQKCGNQRELCSHHILTWRCDTENRLNINNGITLCANCHIDYHSKHKQTETLDNFIDWLDPLKDSLIRNRLDAPMIIPPAD